MLAVVTGATGFIGRALIDRLLNAGDSIYAFVRPETARNRTKMAHLLNRRRVTIFSGGLDDLGAVARAVDGAEIVYHLAFLYRQAWAPGQDFLTPNLRATETVLRASVQAGVRRFVLTGSVSVYGWPQPRWRWPVAEDAPLLGRGSYADTKILTERVVRQVTREHGLPHAILRLPHVYGGGAPTFEYFLSGLLPPGLLARRPDTVVDPTLFWGRVWHWVHVSDAVDGVIRAARRPEGQNGTFNIAGRCAVTRLQVVNVVHDLVQKHVRGLPLRPTGPEPSCLQMFDIRKAGRMLDFEPRIGVPAGLAEVLEGLIRRSRGAPRSPAVQRIDASADRRQEQAEP